MKHTRKSMQPDVEKTYNEQAEAFAENAPNLMTWKYIGSRALDTYLSELYNPNTRILDQGSASARLEQHFTSNGVLPQNITGIELSGDQVEIAKKRMPDSNFIHGDIREVNLMDGMDMDVVVSHMVYEFLDPEGLDNTLKHAHAALKPGGVLAVVVTHPNKMTASSGVSEPGWFTTTAPWGGEIQNWYRTVEDYNDSLTKAGFNIISIDDLEIPDDAKEMDAKEYERYKSYGPIRLGIKAYKSE